MAKKAQAQTQAQAQAQAQALTPVEVRNKYTELSSDMASNVALSAVANLMTATVHEVGKDEVVMVGDKELTSMTLKQAVVTADTLINYSKVSTMALAVEMGRLVKAIVERDGFKSVNTFIKKAFGSALDENTISRYYKVGRIFGDPDTHAWKRPIPADVSITNLGVCLSLFKGVDVSTMTDNEVDTLFNEFMDEYVYTERIALRSTLKTIRKDVNAILNPDTADIPTTAEDVTDGEQGDTSENAPQTNENSVSEVQRVYVAQEHVTALMEYFKGADDSIMTALATLAERLAKDEQAFEQADVETEAE